MTDKGNPHIEDPEQGRLKRMLLEAEGPEERALAYLFLGGLGERRRDWEYAIRHYARALAEETQRKDFCYFGNNNLGYSLIQLGRFDEAEGYCLAAIELDTARHNAHKNLGLVRLEQKRWLEAAFCFTEAYRLCPGDKRAWHLLSAVLNSQPALLKTSPDLCTRIAKLGAETAPLESWPQ